MRPESPIPAAVPTLSIVTVSYNSAATIADTLASVASQAGVAADHVVIDGQSTDGTVALIEKHRKDISHFVSEPDKGLYHAMNKGIAAARGDYLGFLNSDDVYGSPDVLARVAQALAEQKTDAAYGDLLYVSQDDPGRVVRYWRSNPYRPGLFREGWHPPHPTLFVRTALLRELGGFDTRYRYHADFDLMVRLFVDRGISSTYVPGILVRMRTGGQSNRSLRNIYRGNRESYEIARRFGVASTPLWVARKLLWRLPQFIRRPG